MNGNLIIVVLLVCINLISRCATRIIGAAILPHGDFAFDPSLLHHKIGAERLHSACQSVADWITNEMEPDVIFLTTPHGLKLNHNFLIYENDFETGDAFVGDDLHDAAIKPHKLHLNISTHKALARKVVRLLSAYGNNVEGLSSFGKRASLPLKWAEIIPIKYLDYIGALLLNGNSLWNILDQEEMDIMLLVSADLAHTHFDAHNMPYGQCECAQRFDDAVSEWITSMDRDFLLQTARLQQRKGA